MSQITTTAGGSGNYALGTVNGGATLFTTPNVANAIFIVTFFYPDSFGMATGTGVKKEKIIVGPNTPVVFPDTTVWAANAFLSYNWVQMIVS